LPHHEQTQRTDRITDQIVASNMTLDTRVELMKKWFEAKIAALVASKRGTKRA
jgi:hypothetical protein